MERFTRLILISFASISILAIAAPAIENEFIKPKAKPTSKLKPEDICYESLPLTKSVGHMLQELGTFQVRMTELVNGVVENNKKAPLKNATQEQLQQLKERQDSLQQSLDELDAELMSYNEYIKSLQ